MKDLLLAEFKPCVHKFGLVTQILLEDVSHYTVPVYQGSYRLVDWLKANDDDRIVSIQVWC